MIEALNQGAEGAPWLFSHVKFLFSCNLAHLLGPHPFPPQARFQLAVSNPAWLLAENIKVIENYFTTSISIEEFNLLNNK